MAQNYTIKLKIQANPNANNKWGKEKQLFGGGQNAPPICYVDIGNKSF